MYILIACPVLLEITSPALQFKRFRGKINIQRPQKPHYDRALVNAVTTPVFARPTVTQKCFNRQQQEAVIQKRIENPYEKIIAKEVANWFAHSKMVAIFHVNSISADEMFKARVAFHKQNMHLKIYGKSIIRQAIADTRYDAILPLFESKNCVIFSPEQKLPQLLKICKKIPQLMLLAGIVEQRLMSKTELSNFAAMPSLEMARAQLVAVLQQAGGNNVVSSLQAHQTNLCGSLDAYVTQETEEKSAQTPEEAAGNNDVAK